LDTIHSLGIVSKQSLLLVDGDTRSLRVLEVSLRKAGFTVTPAVSVKDALDKLELHTPDLIISETSFPTDVDGFELRRRVRGQPDLADIPFVFLTAETSLEHKIRGLELGVDDFLTKPIYIKEIVTRINILLQKRQRARFDERKDGVRFAGRVADMPVVDVIQTIEVSRKSGVINFTAERGRSAAIYFRDGRVIDAEAGTLQGEDAVYRLLTWSEGEFEVVFRTVRRREAITMSSQGLLMEGMRRLDEWSRLLEQLPPLTHRFEVDAAELALRLGEVPDDNNRILRLIDGKRAVMEVIDASDFGDLECLQAIARLYFEGLLIDLDPGQRPRRDTGKPVPLTMVEDVPTPIEEVASGPIPMTEADARASVKPPLLPEPPPPMPEPAPTPAPPPMVEAAHHDTFDESTWDDPLPDTTAPPATAPEPDGSSHEVAVAAGEEPVAVEPEAILEEEIQGPLMGGYRPSSLRLIDEAVAAAQAIEPSLFDDAEDESQAAVARVRLVVRTTDPRVAAARGLVERTSAERITADAFPPSNGSDESAAPQPIQDDPSPSTRVDGGPTPARSDPPALAARANDGASRTNGETHAAAASGAEAFEPPFDPYASTPIEGEPEPFDDEGPPTDPSRRRFAKTVRRDTSPRMIGSLGRDRAEASGELVPTRPTPEPIPESQRELVTILPRRITREIPTVQVEDTELAKPALPVALPPPPRISIAGGVRRTTGPGSFARVLLVAAAVLMAAAVYMKCHKKSGGRTAVVAAGSDAGELLVVVAVDAPPSVPAAVDAAVARPDAAIALHVPRDAAVIYAPTDAAVVAHVPADAALALHVPVDAGVAIAPRHDAAVVATADAGAGGDKAKDARDLMEKAHDAIDEGDYEKALSLTEASLKLRKTARTYLVRAQALQRLDRVDDALQSVDEAMKIIADYAPAWELRGMILWSARRYDDARAALTRYLELEPNGKSAPAVRRLLQEPR
jgi:DNA-binding response OmpR family regulator